MKQTNGTYTIEDAIRTWEYDPEGKQETFTDETGCEQIDVYQPTGDPENRRLLSENNCQNEPWSYDYDARWDELSFKNGPGLAGDITYEYDTSGRLKRTFTYAKGDRHFAYKDNDLLAASWDSRVGSLLTYEYDATNRLQEIWSSGTLLREYRYDANGNLEKARARQYHVTDTMVTDYTWTSADLLETATWKPSESGSASFVTDYDYVPQKAQVSRIVHPTGVAFEYGYDTQDQLEEIRFGNLAQPLVDHIGYTAWGGVERVERSNGIDTDYEDLEVGDEAITLDEGAGQLIPGEVEHVFRT